MTLALSKPWETWRHRGVAMWPGRDEIMRLRPATRWLLLGLCAWAAAAYVLAGIALVWPSSAPTPETLPPRGPRPAPDYAAITERPLFSKSRQAAAIPRFVPPAPPPRDRNITLKGVFLDGSRARAFLTSGAEPQGRWLAANEPIAGWTIASLAPDAVRLTAEGETMTVLLHPPGAPAGASLPRPAMPFLPPMPPPNRPTPSGTAVGVEAGQRPDLQEMSGAPMGVRLFGLGATPNAKVP